MLQCGIEEVLEKALISIHFADWLQRAGDLKLTKRSYTDEQVIVKDKQ